MFGELLQNLPNQFNPKHVGRVLICDADSFAYEAAATSKRLKTAIRKFQMMVLEQMFITQSETARVHLTHKDSYKSGRGNIIGWKQYQGNRDGKTRPPLLEELREAVSSEEHVLPEYTVHLHKVLEADDACMIDAYTYKQDGIMFSKDKDLRQTPYPMHDAYTGKEIQADGIGELWLHETEGGSCDIHGIGRLFFWAQMLRGDTADNIRGLDKYMGKQIGPVRSLEVLEQFNNDQSEQGVAEFVLRAYMDIDQNPLPEGYLLHMMRGWGDSFIDVIEGLSLPKDIQEFIDDCKTREWFTQNTTG